MKVAVIFILLFAAVLCRPAKKVSDSSSESSEEVVRWPAPQAIKKKAPVAPQVQARRVQNVVAAAAAGSDEKSEENSEEEEKAAPEAVEVKSASTVPAADSTSDTASVKSNDSDSHGDEDDETDETEETEEDKEEEEEEEEESSAESGESSTPAPATIIPVVITGEPVVEPTVEPIVPTIVTDTDASRGDSLGGPSDYKSIMYVEDKSYHKVPGPYKSYEFVGTGKKMAYDMTDGNEVEKSVKVYKALQVHSDLLEEGTSTSEVESQALDASSRTLDQGPSYREAAVAEEESTSTSEASTSETTSESSSTPEEEEEENASTDSSASQESEDEEEESSEETIATPGAADSDSDESDSDESEAAADATTDVQAVITAK